MSVNSLCDPDPGLPIFVTQVLCYSAELKRVFILKHTTSTYICTFNIANKFVILRQIRERMKKFSINIFSCHYCYVLQYYLFKAGMFIER